MLFSQMFQCIIRNIILVLHPLKRHPKRMLQLLARTVSIQDPDFEPWMLRSYDGLVCPFYIYGLFFNFFCLRCFFHQWASLTQITKVVHRSNVLFLRQGLYRYGCSVPVRFLHNMTYLPNRNPSSLSFGSPGSFLSCDSK